MRALAFAGCGLFALASTAQAQAPAWPARPITFIVPFAAGGGTDAFARPIAQLLDGQLNQRVIIENRPGAGGTAGAATASKAEPDGYTFFVGAAHHAVAPAIYPKLSYDIEKDFIPVALISRPPQVIVVNPDKVQAKTLGEFIAFAKANPDKLSYGSAGAGTTHHLAGEYFNIMAKTKLNHVPYRGAGPAMQDLLAAQSDLLNAEVQLLLNSSVKVSEVTARIANDAAQKITVATKDQARKTA
jgi:tripartite-type tricarboxylate transporter receptor subunit TctC